jgi:hypothetical protein
VRTNCRVRERQHDVSRRPPASVAGVLAAVLFTALSPAFGQEGAGTRLSKYYFYGCRESEKVLWEADAEGRKVGWADPLASLAQGKPLAICIWHDSASIRRDPTAQRAADIYRSVCETIKAARETVRDHPGDLALLILAVPIQRQEIEDLIRVGIEEFGPGGEVRYDPDGILFSALLGAESPYLPKVPTGTDGTVYVVRQTEPAHIRVESLTGGLFTSGEQSLFLLDGLYADNRLIAADELFDAKQHKIEECIRLCAPPLDSAGLGAASGPHLAAIAIDHETGRVISGDVCTLYRYRFEANVGALLRAGLAPTGGLIGADGNKFPAGDTLASLWGALASGDEDSLRRWDIWLPIAPAPSMNLFKPPEDLGIESNTVQDFGLFLVPVSTLSVKAEEGVSVDLEGVAQQYLDLAARFAANMPSGWEVQYSRIRWKSGGEEEVLLHLPAGVGEGHKYTLTFTKPGHHVMEKVEGGTQPQRAGNPVRTVFLKRDATAPPEIGPRDWRRNPRDILVRMSGPTEGVTVKLQRREASGEPAAWNGECTQTSGGFSFTAVDKGDYMLTVTKPECIVEIENERDLEKALGVSVKRGGVTEDSPASSRSRRRRSMSKVSWRTRTPCAGSRSASGPPSQTWM